MRILSLDPTPIHTIPYRTAGSQGHPVLAHVPILSARVASLPDGLRALVCVSDLQGVAPAHPNSDQPPLLGIVLAEALALLAEIGDLPDPSTIGVILAGDFYARQAVAAISLTGERQHHTPLPTAPGYPGAARRPGHPRARVSWVGNHARRA